MRKMTRKWLVFGIVAMCVLYLFVYQAQPCDRDRGYMVQKDPIKYMHDRDNNAIPYHKDMPIIFIGGMPRSGTTLMRAMIDAHPDVRCGEETRVIPRILGMRTNWERSEVEKRRLLEAGIDSKVLDAAVTAFMLEIIALHGEAAPYLCNKDPFTLKSSVYINKLFPNSKFLLMVRDGRAVVHSIISRKVTITGFNLNDFKGCLAKWNSAMEIMYSQCLQVGADQCMPVYYEQLVLQPELWLKRITKFLKVPWNESVLHHEDFIGKPGGISVSKTEKSSDQIIKPVNLGAIDKWVGHIPADVMKDMGKVAPMLRTLGYDPDANPPNYGNPEPKVADNTLHIQQNIEYWKKREEQLLHKLDAKKPNPDAQVPEKKNNDEKQT